MKNYQAILYELSDMLWSADNIKKSHACDESLSLIQKIDDETIKNEIRKMIVYNLIDLSRSTEARDCIDGLLQSDDYFFKYFGHLARIAYCKHCDTDHVEQAIKSAKHIAKQNNHKADYAIACIELAKYYYKTLKYDACIKELGDVIVVSEELKNTRFLMSAKYYTALALSKKGQILMALEMLRDVSNMAYDSRSQYAAMFSEIKRASLLKMVDRTEETLTIIDQWCDNFETEL